MAALCVNTQNFLHLSLFSQWYIQPEVSDVNPGIFQDQISTHRAKIYWNMFLKYDNYLGE